MAKRDKIEIMGVVRVIHRTHYEVEFLGILDSGNIIKNPALEGTMIKGRISGRMRQFKIRIIVGDRVTMELQPGDLSEGRITFRHKN